MSSKYTLPYDPALLLSENTYIKLSGDNSEITLFKGGGDRETRKLFDDYTENEFEIDFTTEKLFFIKDGVPVAFKRMGASGLLADGVGDYETDGGSEDGGEYLTETLAMTYRSQISGNPMALLTDRVYTENYFGNTEALEYRPFVLIFKDKMVGAGLKQERYEEINNDSNDFWEAAFEYDINQDGFIPEYRTFELYQRPTKSDVNGKVIAGKKKDEVLDGGKKDDHIDGKKGNDIVNGNNGDDALFGSKGRDQLYGSNGDDYLSGGSSDDILEGGLGADVFALSAGDDQIIDFSLADGDKIAVKGKYVAEFIVEATPTGSLVSIDDYGSLELNVNLEGVDLVDFIVQSV